MTGLRTWLFAPALAVVFAACTPMAPVAEPDADGVDASPVPAVPDEDVVDLTIYLRDGDGEGAHLVGVSREVAVDDDLPRRALELLLAGPGNDDGDLEAPLPTTTEIRDFRVEDHTAHVDLSGEVITHADQVGASPANEVLALAALADTLTEFPEIDRVRLSVEGEDSGSVEGVGDVGAFWGGWGLPDVLVRDESLVEPEGDANPLPDLAEFDGDPQAVGSDEADPVDVRGIRARDRTSYLRIVVELGDAHDEDAAAAVPQARAWRTPEGVVLELREVAGYDEDNARLDPDRLTFADVDAEVDGERLLVTVDAGSRHDFSLSTLTSPVRVVLDVRKAAMGDGDDPDLTPTSERP